jgi:hypothetical protein
MSERDELPDASEVTLPEGGEGGVDRPAPPGFHDPAERGSETAAETPPQEDAERLESALREGAGFLRIADPEAPRRRAQETEEGPGTSLA